MPQNNSLEQTIYRSLASKIQLGFFDSGERFPSVQEIAERYQISSCPAQRALKLLEKDGLIKLCRGKETIVLAKPYKNYLNSELFRRRAIALYDLVKSLRLISPGVCLPQVLKAKGRDVCFTLPQEDTSAYYIRFLYHLFYYVIRTLGSRTLISLYYDISSFVQSSFLDIIDSSSAEKENMLFLKDLACAYFQHAGNVESDASASASEQLQSLSDVFFTKIEQYLEPMQKDLILSDQNDQEHFIWEPHKGRTRYCDVIAIDMICKMNQGFYQNDTMLPNVDVLADTYHVSVITIRRTISLLHKLGAVKSINGIGTQVTFTAGSPIPFDINDLMLNENLRAFLEALQLLALTCESVLLYTYPSLTDESRSSITQALSNSDEKRSMVSILSICMQSVVHCCPLMAIREIYSKITLLLLKGSILRINETGRESVPGWAEVAKELSESHEARDAAGFASAFHKLCVSNFISARQSLKEAGFADMDDIISPEKSPAGADLL